MLTLLLNFFIVTERISDWHHFCRLKFLSQFCWLKFLLEPATNTFYGNYEGDNVSCIYACDCLIATSIAIKQVTVSVAIMQLEVSGASDSFCHKNVVNNFYCNYADGSFCCNYAGVIFCRAFCT